jgi:hypothetical protein
MYNKDQLIKIQEIETYMQQRIKELKEYDYDNFKELIENNELHNEIFNTDYYIIGTYEAKQWLNKFGVFDAIEIIQSYENDNFGEITTDLTNPEKITSMIVYILGEELIAELDDQKLLKNIVYPN